MQIHGGMGYAEEFPVSRYFVDARVLSIFEGADETLALKVIARRLVERGFGLTRLLSDKTLKSGPTRVESPAKAAKRGRGTTHERRFHRSHRRLRRRSPRRGSRRRAQGCRDDGHGPAHPVLPVPVPDLRAGFMQALGWVLTGLGVARIGQGVREAKKG